MIFLQLVAPVPEHETAALAFADEVMRIDGDGIHGSAGLYDAASFSDWLDSIARSAAGESQPYLSPSDTFFAIDPPDSKIIGIINIRHSLDSDFMLNYGGHIGYTVRPSERRKGYAAHMLRLALDRCRGRGIDRVLLTCDPSNIASCRTIEACGGVMENEIPYPGTDELVRRFWIDVTTIENYRPEPVRAVMTKKIQYRLIAFTVLCALYAALQLYNHWYLFAPDYTEIYAVVVGGTQSVDGLPITLKINDSIYEGRFADNAAKFKKCDYGMYEISFTVYADERQINATVTHFNSQADNSVRLSVTIYVSSDEVILQGFATGESTVLYRFDESEPLSDIVTISARTDSP